MREQRPVDTNCPVHSDPPHPSANTCVCPTVATEEQQQFSLEWSCEQLRGSQNALRAYAARILRHANNLGQGSRDPFVKVAELLHDEATRMDAPLKRLEAL
jgi:hypothetical protein